MEFFKNIAEAPDTGTIQIVFYIQCSFYIISSHFSCIICVSAEDRIFIPFRIENRKPCCLLLHNRRVHTESIVGKASSFGTKQKHICIWLSGTKCGFHMNYSPTYIINILSFSFHKSYYCKTVRSEHNFPTFCLTCFWNNILRFINGIALCRIPADLCDYSLAFAHTFH